MRSAVLCITYSGRCRHSGYDTRGQTDAKPHVSAVLCLKGRPSRSSTATRLRNISDTLRRTRNRARHQHELCRLGVLLKAPTEQKQNKKKEKKKKRETFIIPLQLSPVDTLKSVRKAMPKLSKVAWRLRPSQGFSSEHSARGREGERNVRGGRRRRQVEVEEGRKSTVSVGKLPYLNVRSTTKYMHVTQSATISTSVNRGTRALTRTPHHCKACTHSVRSHTHACVHMHTH